MISAFVRAIGLLAFLAGCESFAASPIIVVFQEPDYPLAGQPFAYPGGVLFSVCSDGHAYRALSNASVGSEAVRGSISNQAVAELKAALLPLRTECKEHGAALDEPSLRIEAMLGLSHEVFECGLYRKGEALNCFESLVWRTELLGASPASSSLCE